jgi:hypothetical protein
MQWNEGVCMVPVWIKNEENESIVGLLFNNNAITDDSLMMDGLTFVEVDQIGTETRVNTYVPRGRAPLYFIFRE